MSSWYQKVGKDSDVVLTSRIRLARNISGINFPSRMNDEQRQILNDKVKQALIGSNNTFAKSLKYIDMSNVPETEVYSMVERHIISPQFARNSSGKAIIISDDETICIMIGEEDHLRIQVMDSGLDLQKTYDTAEMLDTFLCERLHFAFDEKLGYLTECPTNLGTGLRASVMLHLPLTEASGEMSVIADSVRKIGFTVRGMYGEGSNSEAGIYQLSNQITLGISEKDALNNLTAITTQLVERERELRNNCDKIKLEDRVYRAYGLLKNARIMSSNEMMKLVSMIKLGTSTGILNIEPTVPTTIWIEAQPNMIMRKEGVMDSDERDIKRAELIRNLLE